MYARAWDGESSSLRMSRNAGLKTRWGEQEKETLKEEEETEMKE